MKALKSEHVWSHADVDNINNIYIKIEKTSLLIKT